MDWTFKVRGEPVTLTILDEVTAVRPTQDLLETVSSPPHLLFGDPLGGEYLHGIGGESAETDRRVFTDAGWHFVHPSPRVAIAAEMNELTTNAEAVRQVYATESGNLLIGTSLATVQLPGDMTDDQINEALRGDGLEIVYKLGFAPNLFEVRLPRGRPYWEIVSELQASTDRYVFAEPSLLERITGRFQPTDVNLEKQWQHDKPPAFGINSLEAWDVTRGKRPDRPVRIAIIDQGMQISHPDLIDGIIGGGYFSPENGDPATPDFFRLGVGVFPDIPHGTFCMGMAGARMNNEGQGCGSAPEADLMAIACAHDQTGTQTTLARAIECAVDPRKFHAEAGPQGGADVISCSLATNGVCRDVLTKAVGFANRLGRGGLGTPIFWAVDNEPLLIRNTDVCSDPRVIAVGQSNRAGQVVASAFGEGLDFVAPGFDVFSTRSGGHFNRGDGTSFATPLAAGVAALVLSVKPNLTADQVADLLRKSCDPPEQGHDNRLGFGRLNAAAAIKNALL